MREFDVAIIGTGPNPAEAREEKGYSMGYRHADGYTGVDGCEVVACCDIDVAKAAAFGGRYGISEEGCFEDHEMMLDAVDPDIVSVCTPPKTHPSIVADCAGHPSVEGIHCEKPVAPTWGESTAMAETCTSEEVQLTFNFQNRGKPAVRTVTDLLADGEIGDLRRVEVRRADLMQTGIHNIDLANHFAGDPEVEWVIGQADTRGERVWYTDMHVENQGLGLWAYENGVHGLAFTGDYADEITNAHLRLAGSHGEIELEFWQENPVRVRAADAGGWRQVPVADGDPQTETLRDVVAALREERPSMVGAEKALRVTELVFAIWESAKRRGRVELPLQNTGNALEDLVAGDDTGV